MPTRDTLITALDARIRSLICGERQAFNDVCCEVFRFQYERCEAYRAICDRRGINDVAHWRDIPAVPADAFKSLTLRSFSESAAVATFHTSGTTLGEHGCHYFDDLALYRLASMRSFATALLPEGAPMPIVSLIPAVTQVPDSSLSQMVTWIIDDWSNGDVVVDPSGQALRVITHPTLILGTAFGLADAFDSCRDLELPVGTRIMETGGFKGRSRVVARTALHELYRKAGIESQWVVGEYGMTELSSQWYDGVAGRAFDAPERRSYLPPPWARTRVVDPVTMDDVSDGETGLLLHIDPVNRGSVQAILTGDLGELVKDHESGRDGFRYIGRATGAALRGCSMRSVQ